MKSSVSSRQKYRAFRKKGFDKPDDKTDPSDKSKRNGFLRDYREWLWPFRWSLAMVFLLAIVGAAMDMVWPLAIKKIVDLLPLDVSWAEKSRQLNIFGFGVVSLLVVKQIIDSARSWRTFVLNTHLVQELREKLFSRLVELPLTELSEMKSGGITSRLSGDVDAVAMLVQQSIISPGVAIVRLVLTISILLFLSPKLALASLVLIPPLAVVSFIWMRRVRPMYRSMRDDRTKIDARVTETFGGLRIVRAFRREARERLGYGVGHHTVIRKNLYTHAVDTTLEAVWGLLIPGISVLVVWFGGYLVMKGQASTGDIFAFQIYAVLLINPVWQIINSMSQTQKSLAAMERVFTILRMTPDKPDAPDAIDAPGRVKEMSFENVTFEYRTGAPVIDEFNLTVPGGATVALVGASGAGKTTLTDLVARFHDPTAGAIKLNGIDLRHIKLHSYRAMLAVVQQETFLFDGTVRENISYGLRGASDAEVEDAARRANAMEFIEKLPEKFDTLIGERGFKLSGGQRQRISIARAILANPEILILDEATSNLDTESEQLIQASIEELLGGRTTFVIAHRLSTVTHADIIVVLDGGKIVETGTHEQLMENAGPYFEMVDRQRKSFDAGILMGE